MQDDIIENIMSETIDYYDNNAENYADSTANIDFSKMQDAFLSEIKAGASILDFGCGSGRDSSCGDGERNRIKLYHGGT